MGNCTPKVVSKGAYKYPFAFLGEPALFEFISCFCEYSFVDACKLREEKIVSWVSFFAAVYGGIGVLSFIAFVGTNRSLAIHPLGPLFPFLIPSMLTAFLLLSLHWFIPPFIFSFSVYMSYLFLAAIVSVNTILWGRFVRRLLRRLMDRHKASHKNKADSA